MLSVGEPHQDLDLVQPAAFLAPRLADRLEIAHADGKQHVDRILADDGRQDAARRIDQVADGVGGAADAAVDRRADVGVVEIDFGLLERRLGLHDLGGGRVHRRLVLVDYGLGAELLLGQVQLPSVLQLGVGRFGLGRGEVGLGLLDQRLVLDLLDLIEQVAGLHVLAFAEQDLLEEALDAGAKLDLVDGLDVTDEFEGLARRPFAPPAGRRRQVRAPPLRPRAQACGSLSGRTSPRRRRRQ